MTAINSITVIFDGRCQFCIRCAQWLRSQPSYFPIIPMASMSVEVQTKYPELLKYCGKDPVVVSDTGGVYIGADAWIMCLYAMVKYRGWSITLSRPLYRPLARAFFSRVSKSRHIVSKFMGPAKSNFDTSCNGNCKF